MNADEQLGIGLQQMFELLLREAAVRRKISKNSELKSEQTGQNKHSKDQQVRPGPGDAQVFRQIGRWGRGQGNNRDVGKRVTPEWLNEWLRGPRFRRFVRHSRRKNILFRRTPRHVIEQAHGLPPRGFLGHPAASAAATRGKSSSWWPVMA